MKHMRRDSIFLALRQSALYTVVILALAICLPSVVNAQVPPNVPSAYQPIYSELLNYLNNFNATLPPGSNPAYPTVMSINLTAADSNVGPQLVSGLPAVQPGQTQQPPLNIQLELNALKAMGVQAVMVEVGFPMLYEPFLSGQGQTYSSFVTYYQAVANAVRAAGLKLIVENDTLLTNSDEAGWDVAPFYATLDWNSYQQARAQTAVTIAQTMHPDYLVVLQEPNTEYDNSLQPNVITVNGSMSLLSTILTAVQQAGVPNMKVGAGTGTAQVNPSAMSFISQYVTLPLDFIDFHIYPINGNNLPIAQQIVATAAAYNKPVAMTECGLWKVLDTELPVLTPDEIRSRNPFDFWGPLDAYFFQTMQAFANSAQMLFLDPFGAEYFFTYLP